MFKTCYWYLTIILSKHFANKIINWKKTFVVIIILMVCTYCRNIQVIVFITLNVFLEFSDFHLQTLHIVKRGRQGCNWHWVYKA